MPSPPNPRGRGGRSGPTDGEPERAGPDAPTLIEHPEPDPHWSTNLSVIVAARIAMSAGRALAGVVVPIYLAERGFSAVALAAYVLAVALVSAVLSTAIGTTADAVGRRIFLVVLPLITAVAAVVFAVARNPAALVVAGALGSFGRGSGAGAGAIGPYQPAESAYVTDEVPPAARNRAFGRLASASSLGATVGSLLALSAPRHAHGAALADFRVAFVLIAAASAIAGLLALWLEEAPRPLDGNRSRVRPHWPVRSRWLLYRLWVTNTLNGAAVGMFGPFLTYWLYRRYDVGPATVGVLYAVINVATIASSLSAAGLARRWGLVRTVTVVRMAQAVLLVPMVLAPTFLWAGAVYLVRMVVQRIGMPLRQSYGLALADPSERASVAALSNLPSQVTMAVSPLLTGYLFDEVSLSLPFEIAAALQLANASSFWLLFRHHPPAEERDDVIEPPPAPVEDP